MESALELSGSNATYDGEEDTQAEFFSHMRLEDADDDDGASKQPSIWALVLPNNDDGDLDEEADREFQRSAEWQALEEIVEKEVLATKKRVRRRQKSAAYEVIIGVLESRAENRGFEDDQLLKIWKVVSHPKCRLSCYQRRKLIFTMIPKQEVGKDVVLAVLGWLAVSKGSGIKPSVVISVYQLLNLYMQYFLVDVPLVINKNVVTQILTTPTDNYVIPWKMELLRYVVTPDNFTKSHMADLQNLLKTPGLKRTQKNDIILTFKTCCWMKEIEEKSKLDGSVRSLDLPTSVRPRFFLASQRRQAKYKSSSYGVVSSPHPLADKVFEEFLTAEIGSSEGDHKTLLAQMLELLETDDGTTKLALDPAMLRVFENWVKVILHYYYHPMSSFVKPNAAKYLFLFDRCMVIMQARQCGIDVVSDWVSKYLGLWNFHMFRKPMLCFIPFLEPKHILPRKSMLQRFLSETFTHAGDEFIWDAFASLFGQWFTNYQNRYTDNRNQFKRGIIWLLSLFKGFISGVGLGPNFIGDREPIMLKHKIVMFYKNLIIQAKFLQDSELKEKCLTIPNELVYLISFSKHPDSMEILADILLLLKGKDSPMNQEDTYAKAMILDEAYSGEISCTKERLKPAGALWLVEDDQQEFSQQKEVGDARSKWQAKFAPKYASDGCVSNFSLSGMEHDAPSMDLD